MVSSDDRQNSQTDSATELSMICARRRSSWFPSEWPMYLRVVLSVLAGATVGLTFGQKSIAFGWTTAECGLFSSLYIQLLTTLATPLIFFAILDAFVRTHISGRQGL